MGGIFQFIDLIGIILIGSYSSLNTVLRMGRYVDFENVGRTNNL